MNRFLCILLISGGILSAADKKARDPKAVEEAVAIQVFLDRANFGPGKLDGHLGEFTEKALARYRQSKSGELPSVGAEKETTETSKELPEPKPGELLGTEPKKESKSGKPAAKEKKLNVADLDLKSIEPVYVEYTVTDADIQSAGEFPTKVEEQAKMKWLPYASVAEAVAERFHTDADFLEELNPGMTKALKAGDKVRVPNVQPFELSSVKDLKPGSVVAGEVQEEDSRHGKKEGDEKKEEETPKISVTVSKAEKMLEVQENGRVIAAFPVTVGSDETASPVGEWKVRGIAKLPEFRYDKKMLKEGERSSDFHMLPPGPNNPVGIVWIALNKKGIGIHGSDSPDAIGRNASHGCIRLANWDAAKLVGMVKAGVSVAIR